MKKKKMKICAICTVLLTSMMFSTTVFASFGGFSSPDDYVDYLYEKYNGNMSYVTVDLLKECNGSMNTVFALIQKKQAEIAKEEAEKEIASIEKQQELQQQLTKRISEHKAKHLQDGTSMSKCKECEELNKMQEEMNKPPQMADSLWNSDSKWLY